MAEEEEAGQPQRYCGKCGAPVRPGNTFCASCGTRLTPEAETVERKPGSSQQTTPDRDPRSVFREGTGVERSHPDSRSPPPRRTDGEENTAVGYGDSPRTTARAGDGVRSPTRAEGRLRINTDSSFWQLVIAAVIVYAVIFLLGAALNATVPRSNDGGPGTVLGGMFAVVFTIFLVPALIIMLLREGGGIFIKTPKRPHNFRTPDGRRPLLTWCRKGGFWYYKDDRNLLDPDEYTPFRFLDHTPIPVGHPAFPKDPLIYGEPIVRDGRIIYYRKIEWRGHHQSWERFERLSYRDAKGQIIDKEHPVYGLARKDLEDWYAENKPGVAIPSRYDSRLSF